MEPLEEPEAKRCKSQRSTDADTDKEPPQPQILQPEQAVVKARARGLMTNPIVS